MRSIANFTTILLCCLAVPRLTVGQSTRASLRNLQDGSPTESPIPSPSPSESPTRFPTVSQIPSSTPSVSYVPTSTPSAIPSLTRSFGPTESPEPSPSPSSMPSSKPSVVPSDHPSQSPSISTMPSSTPSQSAMPSSTPSQSVAPSTDTIVMWGVLTATFPGLGELMDDDMIFLFIFLLKEFIKENQPPDTDVFVEPTEIDVLDQDLVGNNLTVSFNVTSVVWPRPLPAGFNYTDHIGWGFQFNLTNFVNDLLILEDLQDRPEPGVGTVGVVQDTTGEADSSEDKWSTVAVVFLILANIIVCTLLLLLCCRFWAFGKGKESSDEESTDEEDLVILTNQSSWNMAMILNDVNMGGAYAAPNANVHKCRSSTCPTCAANHRERTAEFIPASPSWGLRAILGPFTSRSKSRSFSSRTESVDQ